MNSQINMVLSQIRHKLSESAWGPQAPAVAESEGIVTESDDALDQYLSTMVDRVMQSHGSTEEEAADVVFAAIDQLVESGGLPQLPDEDAPEDALSTWIGKAKSMGLHNAVTELARLAMQ